MAALPEIGQTLSRGAERGLTNGGPLVVEECQNGERKGTGVILNVWSARWNGHSVEVRNHFFVAELLIDGELLDKVPGVFRHDLRGTIKEPTSANTKGLCRSCKHQNQPVAVFCAKCGQKLADDAAAHEVRAAVEARFPPPRVECRVFVDGEELFKEGL